MRLDYHGYVDKVWKKSENVYSNYKIFNASI